MCNVEYTHNLFITILCCSQSSKTEFDYTTFAWKDCRNETWTWTMYCGSMSCINAIYFWPSCCVHLRVEIDSVTAYQRCDRCGLSCPNGIGKDLCPSASWCVGLISLSSTYAHTARSWGGTTHTITDHTCQPQLHLLWYMDGIWISPVEISIYIACIAKYHLCPSNHNSNPFCCIIAIIMNYDLVSGAEGVGGFIHKVTQT